MRLLPFLLVVTVLLTFAACGGGGHSVLAPEFASAPGLSATQDVVYTYDISATDPSGGTVSFTLSNGPSGATLNGSTLSWTPSAAQSRVSDGFTVIATSSEGGHATQSWSIVPSGTINGTWINTRWTAAGSTDEPVDWTKLHFTIPQALIPNPDGTFVAIQGSGNADGTFSIPAVPGGYFWLQLGFESFWTSSSSFDYGRDIVGRALGTVPAPESTTFAFNIASLDPVESGDQFAFLTDWAAFFDVLNIGFPITAPPGSTTLTANYTVNSNVDYSAADMGFLLQYEPVSAGAVAGLALGPALTLSNLSLTSGVTNNVVESLNPSPHFSFDLNVKGSQWAPMFQNVGPAAVTPVDAYISMSARPFAPQNVLGAPLNLPLFLPPLTANQGFLVGWPTAGTCGGSVAINPQFGIITSYAPMLTDQDFGMLTYGDPFNPNWVRVFSLCQTASVQVPVPGGGTPATFYFQDGVNITIPTSPIAPLALPAQNPTLNGASFFTTNTVSPTGVSLSWTGSAGATAYTVALLKWATRPDGSLAYVETGRFHTAKTSMTLPVLQAGLTYVIVLTTEVDGRANVETSPYRSALPTAVASVVSAPFTTNSGSQSRASMRNK